MFAPKLIVGITKDLGYPLKVLCDEENGGIVIKIDYPKIQKDVYLLEVVKLEIGPIAALTPTKKVDIQPYCYEGFEKIFKTSSFSVETVTPERSFWEKATILHREAQIPLEKQIPIRYFRHYYDLYMLGNSDYKKTALQNTDLLKAVCHFKEKFYLESWMNYNSILINGIRLVPNENRFKELKNDYNKMKEMIQNLVAFEEIMSYLGFLEKEINNVIKIKILLFSFYIDLRAL